MSLRRSRPENAGGRSFSSAQWSKFFSAYARLLLVCFLACVVLAGFTAEAKDITRRGKAVDVVARGVNPKTFLGQQLSRKRARRDTLYIERSLFVDDDDGDDGGDNDFGAHESKDFIFDGEDYSDNSHNNDGENREPSSTFSYSSQQKPSRAQDDGEDQSMSNGEGLQTEAHGKGVQSQQGDKQQQSPASSGSEDEKPLPINQEPYVNPGKRSSELTEEDLYHVSPEQVLELQKIEVLKTASLNTFVDRNRNFLIRNLDVENFIDVIKNALYHPMLLPEQVAEIDRHQDIISKRAAVVDVLKHPGTSGVLLYTLFKTFRPGLFPEPSWNNPPPTGTDMIRLQVSPFDGSASLSCKLQTINTILREKAHFIENMNATEEVQEFFKTVTSQFDNDVDNSLKPYFFSCYRCQVSLKKGYWLHCLDYATEEKKFEFLKMMKEKQANLFSNSLLSHQMDEMMSSSPNAMCQTEEAERTPDTSHILDNNAEDEAHVFVGIEYEPFMGGNDHSCWLTFFVVGKRNRQQKLKSPFLDTPTMRFLMLLSFQVDGQWLMTVNGSRMSQHQSGETTGVYSMRETRKATIPAAAQPGLYREFLFQMDCPNTAQRGDVTVTMKNRLGEERSATLRVESQSVSEGNYTLKVLTAGEN